MAEDVAVLEEVQREKLTAHVLEIRACRLCPRVEAPPVAPDAVTGAEILLVGQAPGPRERDTNRLFAYTAGTRLFSWFASIGVAEEDFRARVWMAATIRCFPGRQPEGGDRPPAPDEIANCAPFLEREIAWLRPTLVLAIGSMAIARFLPAAPLAERIGRIFPVNHTNVDLEVLPLPHPSGRSTWINQPQNAGLLAKGLSLLAEHPAWKRTFVTPSSPT